MVFIEQGSAILLMVTMSIVAIILVIKYIENISVFKSKIDFVLFAYSIISMIRHYIIWTNRGQTYNYIPLQVCYFTMFIYMYYYLSGNRRVLPFLHIFGFLGIGALIAPGHTFDFGSLVSYIFMIDHIILAVLPFYIIIAHKYYPEYRKLTILPYSFAPLFVISILLSNWINSNQYLGASGVSVQTWIMEANYFFLIRNPITQYAVNPWIVAVIQIICMVLFGALATWLGQKIYKNVYEHPYKKRVEI
jgi:hypothetical protein